MGSHLEALGEALDALVSCDAADYCDSASIEVLHRLASRLEAFVTEAAAAFDASEEWAADGAKTASAWIATRCALPRGAARRRVALGKALRRLPECAEAWREGRIGADQAKVIASARRHRTEESMERDEAMLVSYASSLRVEDFYRSLCYWKQLADPDGADESDEDKRCARQVYLTESIDGTYLGQITLDPISGATVAGELERIERRFFEADVAEATERLGYRPRLEELQRNAGQRRADALVEMATRSASTPEDAQRPVPLFSVLVGYETLRGRICQLENGTVISPASLLPWMEEAYFERAVFSLSGRVEVSERARLFTGATRRALEVRDQMCTHPYCQEPAHNCQADHIEPYAAGGLTTQENGRLLCGVHNRLRNHQDQARGHGRDDRDEHDQQGTTGRQHPPPGPSPPE
jgi:hypothetical protein